MHLHIMLDIFSEIKLIIINKKQAELVSIPD